MIAIAILLLAFGVFFMRSGARNRVTGAPDTGLGILCILVALVILVVHAEKAAGAEITGPPAPEDATPFVLMPLETAQLIAARLEAQAEVIRQLREQIKKTAARKECF